MHLDRKTLSLYALPAAGITAMHWLVMIYLLKFSTDTLGFSPAIVGALFAAGRVWDAVSDPAAGSLSDRTRSAWGRRRPWMLASAVPLGLSFYALWSPPEGLAGAYPAVWLGGSLLLFYTATTCFNIPHFSLGAELSPEHHERTRISAHRMGAEVLGMVMAVTCLHFLESATAQREVARSVAIGIGAATAIGVALMSLLIREPRNHQTVAIESPWRAFLDVARNPHALRISAAVLFAELGLGSLMVAIPYTTNMGGQDVGIATRMGGFIVLFLLAIPVWVAVSKRLGKAKCWLIGSSLCALCFLSMGIAATSFPAFLAPLTAMIGLGHAAMRVFPPSIKADIIDWDEAQTGQRKEGTYFAAWNMVDKVAVAIVGFAIPGSDGGVDPEGVLFVVSYVPAVFIAISAYLLSGFRLDAKEHARLRVQIDARAAKRTRRLAPAYLATSRLKTSPS